MTLFYENGVLNMSSHPAIIQYSPVDPHGRIRYQGALRKGSLDVREGHGRQWWATGHTYVGSVRLPSWWPSWPSSGWQLSAARPRAPQVPTPHPPPPTPCVTVQFVGNNITGQGEKTFPPTTEIVSEKGEVRGLPVHYIVL